MIEYAPRWRSRVCFGAPHFKARMKIRMRRRDAVCSLPHILAKKSTCQQGYWTIKAPRAHLFQRSWRLLGARAPISHYEGSASESDALQPTQHPGIHISPDGARPCAYTVARRSRYVPLRALNSETQAVMPCSL